VIPLKPVRGPTENANRKNAFTKHLKHKSNIVGFVT
jgi:hypothetical protein